MKGVPILVVEDNPMNQKLTKTLLALEGADVRVAESAEQALQVLETFRPAIILTDIQMPGMDGLQLTALLKSREDMKGIRIVALTAYAMRGDRDRFLAAGCDGYISKPIDAKTFAGVVASYLRDGAAPEGGHGA
jgi:two-component system cell cycle response regulator DivK